MNCSLCGEICHCHSEPPPPQLTEPNGSAWREEIAARLNRFRSRRKIRPPRYPSLRLQFETPDTSGASTSLPGLDVVSDQALALDEMTERTTAAEPRALLPLESPEDAAAQAAVSTYSGAKIIEFPRPAWAPPVPPPDQLAEPVVTRPRILEVQEVAPDPPALGGITIDAARSSASAKQPGLDLPLQTASLTRRVFAGMIDGLVVLFASALFGAIFWKVAAVRPPLAQILLLAAGLPCLFWASYQYLLSVYGGSTPGMLLGGLKLARFDGSLTTRSLRRWRVVASYLSAASLGMGFLWALLDEDSLCWHDRITKTYLTAKRGRLAAAQPAGDSD